MRRNLAGAVWLVVAVTVVSAQDLPHLLPGEPLLPGAAEFSLLPPDELRLTPPVVTAAPAPPPFRLRLAPLPVSESLLPPLELGASATLAAAARFALKQIRFQGNHVFSSRALHHLVAGLEGREVTFDDLEGARQAVTLHYVNAGYINSGAVIEDQGVAGGIITIKVVEGQLTKIEVSGNWWFRSWWLRGEVRRFAGQPLNERRLREGLQLLRQLPGILQVNSELMPGSKPGEAILDLSVKERQPFRLALDYTNARPPSVGSQAVTLQAADLNLTGHNDPLIVSWGLLRGKDADFAYSGADNLAGSYTFPITPWGTTVEVRASRNDSSILEEAFRALDITSETTEYGGTLRQPLFQSLAWDIGLSGGFARKMNDSFLLQRPFSLSPGAIDGSTEVDVLSAGFDVSNRSTKHVFSLRAAFNWGLDAFDATIHDGAAVSGARSVPDGRFFSWVGQAQYVRRLNENGLLAIARVNAQLSDGPLLSLEQFPIGGVNSVRGYRENTLLRDNGVFGSLELRYPIWQIGKDELRRPILTLVPFVDLGTGWRSARGGEASASDDRETLASVGLGFVFEPVSRVRAQLFWGRALNRDFVIRENQTLQDYGLHFSITVSAF